MARKPKFKPQPMEGVDPNIIFKTDNYKKININEIKDVELQMILEMQNSKFERWEGQAADSIFTTLILNEECVDEEKELDQTALGKEVEKGQFTKPPLILPSTAFEILTNQGRSVVLGTGAKSRVWLARNTYSNVLVAIKAFVKTTEYSTLLNEAAATLKARELLSESVPMFCGFMELKEDSPFRYFYQDFLAVYTFVEFLSGIPASLNIKETTELIKRGKNFLDGVQWCDVFCQLIDIAKTLCENDIIHRDLNANNIMLSLEQSEPVVHVIDFGLALIVKNNEKDVSQHEKLVRKNQDLTAVMRIIKSVAELAKLENCKKVAMEFINKSVKGKWSHSEAMKKLNEAVGKDARIEFPEAEFEIEFITS